MGRIDIDALTGEISDAAPCGDNLEYDAAFIALQQAAQSLPEQVMGETVVAAREPDWRAVEERAAALLARSRHLQIAILLTRALLNVDGLAGLRDGLDLLHRLLDGSWEHVHPQLDPDDDNDPTLRINIIAALCDPNTFLREIRATPLVVSRGFGLISYRDVAIATGELVPTGGGDEAVRDIAQINAAFMECDGDALAAVEDAARDACAQVAAIEYTLTRQVGVRNALDMTPLAALLKAIHRFLDARMTQRGLRAAPVGAAEADAGGASTQIVLAGGTPASAAASGDVAGRDDVLFLIDKICAYYARAEPSSPVPLLLKRARRLVNKEFIEIMRDLAPDGLAQIELIRGADTAAD